MIVGVVLAAGASRRFGSQKLLASAGGPPLARRTVETLLGASLDEVVVVVGSEAAAVARSLVGLRVRIVTNPAFADGMSTTLRVGLDALPRGCRAALIALADQPGAAAVRVVEALLERYRISPAPIVAPLYRGAVRGNPVLFDSSVFDELRAVTGDEGGRSVIARDPSRVVLVETNEEVPRDVDTPEDLDE